MIAEPGINFLMFMLSNVFGLTIDNSRTKIGTRNIHILLINATCGDLFITSHSIGSSIEAPLVTWSWVTEFLNELSLV